MTQLNKEIVVAISDGHGMATYGKRSPILPAGMRSSTGNFMHENEFNSATAKKLAKRLKDHHMKPLMVSPGDDDTSLTKRVKTANDSKADVFVSIHANAFSHPAFGPQCGIETFCYTKGSEASKRLAAIVQNNMIKGTGLRNRGVKQATFYELRATNMPAILLEAGFMDNLQEVKLLLSDSYRTLCAEILCESICKFFGRQYVALGQTELVPVKDEVAQIEKPAIVVETDHYADPIFDKLVKEGVVLHEKNFNRNATRAEVIACLDAITQMGIAKGLINLKYNPLEDGSDVHWIENSFDYLNTVGMNMRERNFNRDVSRAVMFAFIAKYITILNKEYTMSTVVGDEHWGEPLYRDLTEKFGLTIHDKRFDDTMTRGELFTLLLQFVEKYLYKK